MATHDVLVIDPSTLFRQGLRQLLPADFNVVAEGRTIADIYERWGLPGPAGMAGVSSRDAAPKPTPARPGPSTPSGFSPALVLFDIGPGGDLRGAVDELRALAPGARLVHLTTGVDRIRLRQALDAGVDGYLSKDRSANALVQSLHLVMLGEKVYPADLALMLTQAPAPRAMGAPKGLSTRETQILRALVRGDSNKMIANQLQITEATVKVHLKSLLRKISCSNRTQAAIWALHNGLGEQPPAYVVGAA